MTIQRVRSKSAKTEALLADPALKPYIPDTRAFDRRTVEEMLDRYGMIYVKPVYGTFGNGVIRVEKREDSASPYFFQSGERQYRFGAFEEMFAKLQAVKKQKPYLAQQGIHLMTYEGRRFDLRVMVQKNPARRWETTGMIGRLSHPRKIVTNYHSGGTPLPVEKLFAPVASADDAKAYMSRLGKLGVDVASALEKKFPKLKEIGVDVAVDEDWTPWILEVNTLPDPFLFRKLPDQTVFKRMYTYAIAYGRFPNRKRKR